MPCSGALAGACNLWCWDRWADGGGYMVWNMHAGMNGVDGLRAAPLRAHGIFLQECSGVAEPAPLKAPDRLTNVLAGQAGSRKPGTQMAKIKLSLYRLIPTMLLALLRYVVSKMTGNPHFATPAVPLADMTTMGDNLETAINKAKHGGLDDRILRNNLVTATQNMLRKQADYVRLTAQGDEAILASSGFELAKTPQPVGLPGTPFIRFVRMTGKQGQAEVAWTAQHGADAYHVRLTDKDPNIHNEWEVVGITTKARFLLTHLDSYKAYWVSVSAIGAAGEGLMSDPAIARAA